MTTNTLEPSADKSTVDVSEESVSQYKTAALSKKYYNVGSEHTTYTTRDKDDLFRNTSPLSVVENIDGSLLYTSTSHLIKDHEVSGSTVRPPEYERTGSLSTGYASVYEDMNLLYGGIQFASISTVDGSEQTYTVPESTTRPSNATATENV